MARTHTSVRIEASDGVAAHYHGVRMTNWGAQLRPSVHVQLSHDLTVWADPELVVAKLSEAVLAARAAVAEGRRLAATELGGAA